ncbi:hypothetical protein FIBSPDRAFT_904673 [Athelia psychrophila]|uniref:Uncharacterized protein n=1 Tax=Athelia psychrophila TaxID=1759441 RepID=A0A167UFI2_9AGAM|nr:hypothetical protein FIBSPDRAFT_904673 [Fibularhizoctonia sp. CBS 109695]
MFIGMAGSQAMATTIYGNALAPTYGITSLVSSPVVFSAVAPERARERPAHLNGCYWNMPAKYDNVYFESYQGDGNLHVGVYGSSTWLQGVSPTPSAHPIVLAGYHAYAPASLRASGSTSITSVAAACDYDSELGTAPLASQRAFTQRASIQRDRGPEAAE